MSTAFDDEPTPGAGPGDGDGDGLTNDDRTWGVLAHAAAFAGFVVPFGNVLGPLLVWAIKKDESQFVAENARRALNFQVTWLLLTLFGIAVLIVATIIAGVAVPPGLFFVALAWLLVPLVLLVIAIIRVSDGEVYRYPLDVFS